MTNETGSTRQINPILPPSSGLKVKPPKLGPTRRDGARRARMAQGQKGRGAIKRISATRELKNARHLQKIAPQLMPTLEPAEGFASVIPIHVLAHLHRPERRGKLVMGGQLAEQVKGLKFPPTSNSAVDPLFNGTLFFVRIQF